MLGWWLLVACGGGDAKSDSADTGGGAMDGYDCTRVETPLALDAAAPDGRVAAELLAAAGTAFTVPLTYEAGTETELTLTFTATEAVWVDLEQPEPGPGPSPSIYLYCDDYLAVSGTLAFQTADGAFDTNLALNLAVSAEGALEGGGRFPVADFGGSFDWSGFAEDGEAVEAELSLVFDQLATSGGLGAFLTGDDGSVAWAENVAIARWGAAVE